MSNVLPDPHFDSSVAAWRCTRGTSIASTTLTTAEFRSPPSACRLTRVHATDTGTMNVGTIATFPTEPGRLWYGSAWVLNKTATARSFRCAVVWQDSGGVDTFMYGIAPPAVLNAWYQVQVAARVPAAAVSVQFNVEGRQGWTNGQFWDMDDVVLENARSVVSTEDGLLNVLVDIQAWPDLDYQRDSSVLPIAGREEPIVLLDTLRLPQSEITFATRTDEEAEIFLTAMRMRKRLFLQAQCAGIPDTWFTVLSVTRSRVSTSRADNQIRLWSARIQEVKGP